MSGFDMNEFIARAPEQVFDFITNPNNAPKIMASVKSTVKLTEGPAGVGTRYQETRIMQGKEQHSELEIVAFEPPHDYSMMNVTEGITTTYHYHLQTEQSGTRVSLVCQVEGKGVKKLLLPVVVAVLKKEDGDHLQRLKQVMEA
jgi:uncharacterized protein YndB with AHSA1/START domain